MGAPEINFTHLTVVLRSSSGSRSRVLAETAQTQLFWGKWGKEVF